MVTLKGALLAFLLLAPFSIEAQSLITDSVVTYRAEVLEVVDSEQRIVPGTDVVSDYQTIEVRILTGDKEGTELLLDNDYLELKKGDVFYLTHTTNDIDGTDYYAVGEPYRIPALVGLGILFLVTTVLLGGIQGVRGLASLVLSLLLIFFVLLPGMQAGYSPVWISILVSSLIIVVGSYVTHGFNRMTSTAVLGMIATVVVTGVLATFSLSAANLSGFTGEEATYLNLNSRGSIDLAGLLLGGILIGLLGVLYDAAIGQSVAVEELKRAGAHLTNREVYLRAIRIGREHIGALVNTLAIAYVGASLPLLLLLYTATEGSWLELINREFFASEVVRILVSSVGLILVVPVTTALAVAFIRIPENREDKPSYKGHSH